MPLTIRDKSKLTLVGRLSRYRRRCGRKRGGNRWERCLRSYRHAGHSSSADGRGVRRSGRLDVSDPLHIFQRLLPVFECRGILQCGNASDAISKKRAGDFGEFGADAAFEGDVGVHFLPLHPVDDVGQAVGH